MKIKNRMMRDRAMDGFKFELESEIRGFEEDFGRDPRRRAEQIAGSMVSKDMSAPANCPPEAINEQFPDGVIKFNNYPKDY